MLLEVRNLCKSFPDFELNNISFTLPAGAIMAIAGRNACGKSTTMKALLSFVHADSGEVFIDGKNIKNQAEEISKIVGFISASEIFYKNLKIKKITAITKNFFSNWNQNLYESLIKKFELDENKLIKNLSTGMKIKYQLALCMSHEAKLLILDEPTSSLDPVSREEINEIFKDYVKDGEKSILFSTHVSSDLENCADFITYIKKGNIVFTGKLSDFKSQMADFYNLSEPSLDKIIVSIEKENK